MINYLTIINAFLTQGRTDGASERMQLLFTFWIWFTVNPTIVIETTNDWSSIELILGMSGAFNWITLPNRIKSHGTSNCTSRRKFANIVAVFWEIKFPFSRFNKNFRNFSYQWIVFNFNIYLLHYLRNDELPLWWSYLRSSYQFLFLSPNIVSEYFFHFQIAFLERQK